MDLSKALDKVMSLNTKEAIEYAHKYVEQLNRIDARAVVPTGPELQREVARLHRVFFEKPDTGIVHDDEDEDGDTGITIVNVGEDEEETCDSNGEGDNVRLDM